MECSLLDPLITFISCVPENIGFFEYFFDDRSFDGFPPTIPALLGMNLNTTRFLSADRFFFAALRLVTSTAMSTIIAHNTAVMIKKRSLIIVIIFWS